MKKYIEYFKELKKKPYGKAVFFFGFYIIFFIIIALLARVNGTHPIRESDFEKGNSKTISAMSLEKLNYSFDYEIVLDGNSDKFNIRKENDYKYKYNEKDYYQSELKTFVKDDTWVPIDSPIKFNKLMEYKIIGAVIKSSYIESKTTYDNGNVTYNLLISTNTLNKLLDNKDTDFSEVPNKITVTMDKYNCITDIKYNLDSYCKNNNMCSDNLSINVTYSDFNNAN